MAQQFYLPPFDHERLSAPAPAHRVVGRPRPKDSTDVGNRVLTGQETELYRLRYLTKRTTMIDINPHYDHLPPEPVLVWDQQPQARSAGLCSEAAGAEPAKALIATSTGNLATLKSARRGIQLQLPLVSHPAKAAAEF